MINIKKIINEEGDHKSFEYRGYQCEIKRVSELGHLCGYVLLNRENVFYGRDCEHFDIECHGGLTYSASDNNKWRIGFDCAHAMDFVPGIGKQFFEMEKRYKNMEFCTSECMKIVDQLINIQNIN